MSTTRRPGPAQEIRPGAHGDGALGAGRDDPPPGAADPAGDAGLLGPDAGPACGAGRCAHVRVPRPGSRLGARHGVAQAARVSSRATSRTSREPHDAGRQPLPSRFPGVRRRARRRVARAREAGVGSHADDLHPDHQVRAGEGARRALRRPVVLGRRPSAQCGERGRRAGGPRSWRMAADPKVIGIGETGLDFFYDHSPREEQKASFREHIAAAAARPACR